MSLCKGHQPLRVEAVQGAVAAAVTYDDSTALTTREWEKRHGRLTRRDEQRRHRGAGLAWRYPS